MHGHGLQSDSGQVIYTTDLLYIVVLYLTKCSAALFYLRISPSRPLFRAVMTMVGLSTAWAVVSILIVALRCHPSHSWVDIITRCPELVRDLNVRYKASS